MILRIAPKWAKFVEISGIETSAEHLRQALSVRGRRASSICYEVIASFVHEGARSGVRLASQLETRPWMKADMGAKSF